MNDSGPKIRDDLILSRQEQGGTTHFVVKDPRARRFFRFKEPEYFIAQQLDGTTSLDAVRQRTSRSEKLLIDVDVRYAGGP